MGFFVALLQKDLLVNAEWGENTNSRKILWLNNRDTSDIFLFPEAYTDEKNSHCTTLDSVRTELENTGEPDRAGVYRLP